MGAIIRPATILAGTLVAGGTAFAVSRRAWDGHDNATTSTDTFDAPDGHLFSDGLSGAEWAQVGGAAVAGGAIASLIGGGVGALASAKLGALPSTATRWATTLGVAAGVGLLAGGLLSGTRDDPGQVKVTDHDLVLLAGYAGGDRTATSLGAVTGPTEGFTNIKAAKAWIGKQTRLNPVLAMVEDGATHRITLHELTVGGKPLDVKQLDSDGNYVYQNLAGFRDTNPGDGTVRLLTQDSYYGNRDPGLKGVVPQGQTAEQLLGVGH